jgi:hypothetical protein
VPFPGGDVGENFLLQEFKVGKVDGLIRFGKEKFHKFSKKGLQQFFEQAVVVDLVFVHRAVAPVWF